MSTSKENNINESVRSAGSSKGRAANDAMNDDDAASDSDFSSSFTMTDRTSSTPMAVFSDVTSPPPVVASSTATTNIAAAPSGSSTGSASATAFTPGLMAAAAAAEARRLRQEEEREVAQKAKDASQLELDKLFDEQQEQKFVDCEPYRRPEGLRDEITLFPHQQDGVRWLVHQERSRHRILPFYKEIELGMAQTKWWHCTLNNKKSKNPPYAPPSSILADDMGLGKTIQTIALILSNKPTVDVNADAKCNLIVAPLSVIAAWQLQIKRFVKPGYLTVDEYRGVDREAVLKKVKKGAIDILLVSYETLASDFKAYEDMLEEEEMRENDRAAAAQKKPKKKAKRSQLADAWKKKRKGKDDDSSDSEDDFDPDEEDSEDDDDHYLPAALTRKRRSAAAAKTKSSAWIFRIPFHRIILDEGHGIRNSTTTRFKAVMELEAVNKLVISGTIYVNRPSDLQSLFKFLQVEPLSDESLFKDKVTDPIADFKEIGLARVRTIVSFLSLRRTKDVLNTAIQLPPKELKVVTCHWDDKDNFHRERHDIVYRMTRAVYASLMGARGQKGVVPEGSWLRMLAYVTRCRQSCLHGALVPNDIIETAEEILKQLEESELTDGESLAFDLNSKEAQELLRKIMACLGAINSDDGTEHYDSTCAVCFNNLEDDTACVLKSCKHVLCGDCLHVIKSKGSSKCPMCRRTFSKKDIISKSVAEKAAKKAATEESQDEKKVAAQPPTNREEKESTGERQLHPKQAAVLEELSKLPRDEKAVIFSEWTSVLDIVQDTLEANGYSTTRIDGTMNTDERVEAITEFESDEADSPRVIMCSMMATGVGITLTRGSLAIIMEPYWNEAVEEQAWCRIHRIGQTRPVRIVRLIMKDSLEERMLHKVQQGKAALGKGSMAKLKKEDRDKARLTALKDLFELDGSTQRWEGVYADDDVDQNGNLDGFIVDDGEEAEFED